MLIFYQIIKRYFSPPSHCSSVVYVVLILTMCNILYFIDMDTAMTEITLQRVDDDVRFMEKYPDGIPLVEMIPFYELLARDEPLKLEWVCPGKRKPKNDEAKTNTVLVQRTPSVVAKVTAESQPSASKLAEFDFDEGSVQALFPASGAESTLPGATPPLRRVGGLGRHPPRQPRVANMDKILNDLFRNRRDTGLQQHETTDLTKCAVPASETVSMLVGDDKQTDVLQNNKQLVDITTSVAQPPIENCVSVVSCESEPFQTESALEASFPTTVANTNQSLSATIMLDPVAAVPTLTDNDSLSVGSNQDHCTISQSDCEATSLHNSTTVAEPWNSQIPSQLAQTQIVD
ncbi:hypothetical protein EG68_02474 [Paragonimus skrjabini miyazakii]|uniref:Uncharacterized protein n=1 Tax=Paragonimus skrjabini miyazakii TaxID=59628 RepID=A0A8S9YG43_9TREM|nr:hypothetical protein EG68_02474 [Paragonimus skrjabini miyazakii]